VDVPTSTTSPRRSREIRVRPLQPEDGRSVGLLIEGVYRELNTVPNMSVEDTVRLFETPWLRSGAGLVMERGGQFGGYAWARTMEWRGGTCVHIGLTLGHGFRSPATYRALTDRLLELAARLGAEQGIERAMYFCRGVDTIHPDIIQSLGFAPEPVSTLGFTHDLALVPTHPLPPGFSFRAARLPEDRGVLLRLAEQAFDNPALQGEPLADNYYDYLLASGHYRPGLSQVVEARGEPVAYDVVAPGFHGAGCYELVELGVVPARRNHGIGSALISHFLNLAKSEGATRAVTATYSSNRAATLYWRMGFRPDALGTYNFFTRPTVAERKED
jgi:GNAT superfamily N-acetyltransferase